MYCVGNMHFPEKFQFENGQTFWKNAINALNIYQNLWYTMYMYNTLHVQVCITQHVVYISIKNSFACTCTAVNWKTITGT